MVTEAGCRTKPCIILDRRQMSALRDVGVAVATQGHQHALSDRHRVGAHRQRFRDVGPAANAAGNDQLHDAAHIEIVERLDRLTKRRKRRGGAALHAVDDHHVRAGVHRQLHVVEHPRRAHLHIDRLLPIRDLAQFLDFDHQIVGPRPIRMARRGSLVDAFGQGAHARDPRIDFLTQQHAAAARFGTLADHDFDGICTPHVVGIEAIARGQALIHQHLRRGALLGRHAAVARGRRRAHLGRGAAEGLLDSRGQRPKAHAGHGDGNGELDGLGREARAQQSLGRAALAIAFERIARQRGGEEQQVVEIRYPALRPQSADFVQTGRGRALNVLDGVAVESRRFFQLQATHAISTPGWHRHASDTDSWRTRPA